MTLILRDLYKCILPIYFESSANFDLWMVISTPFLFGLNNKYSIILEPVGRSEHNKVLCTKFGNLTVKLKSYFLKHLRIVSLEIVSLRIVILFFRSMPTAATLQSLCEVRIYRIANLG